MMEERTRLTVAVVAAVIGAAILIFALARVMGGHHEAVHDEHAHQVADVPMHMAEPSGQVVDGVRVVQVIARQFAFEPDVVVVRQGEKVRLEVTSEDVDHGLAIEQFGVDVHVPAGGTAEAEFTAEQAGSFPFHCSVYCGPGHSEMAGTLLVLPEQD